MTGDNKIERPGELPALVLAYVGDAVYELLIREHLVSTGLVRVDRLHSEATQVRPRCSPGQNTPGTGGDPQ